MEPSVVRHKFSTVGHATDVRSTIVFFDEQITNQNIVESFRRSFNFSRHMISLKEANSKRQACGKTRAEKQRSRV
jgi:hypothetical protein